MIKQIHLISEQIKTSIDKSILCWLATSDVNNFPNVSPKEIFSYIDKNTIVIANIASPQSLRNIKVNDKVAISFIEIFKQKGFQLKGTALIIEKQNEEFEDLAAPLLKMTGDKYPFNELFKIHVTKTKAILAPKYVLYPETTEKEQIESALKTYGVQK